MQWIADIGTSIPTPGSGPLAWVVVGAGVLIALAPVVVARINQHVVNRQLQHGTHQATQPPTAASAVPGHPSALHMFDASGELLRQLVHDLQEREERSDARTHELERELGETKARLAAALAEIAQLRSEVGRLTDRLTGGRHNG